MEHLDRGDFLAEVIEYLHGENTETLKDDVNSMKLKVQEFWASEEYFFHTQEQMDLVSKYCPDIKKMLFYFQNTYWYFVLLVLIF